MYYYNSWKDEKIQTIKYGRYKYANEGSVMCYPTFITNVRTIGPLGKDVDDSTDGFQIPIQCFNEAKG